MAQEKNMIRAKVGLLKLAKAAWQRLSGLQDDGLQSGRFRSLQGTL
jgi:hypothetical protein